MGFFQRDEALFPETQAQSRVDIQSVLKWVYVWMGLGLATTAFVAYLTATNQALLSLALNPGVMIVSIIATFGLVIALSFGMTRRWLTPNLAMVFFFVYAGLMGFTLSVILLVYDIGTIYTALATTSVLFGVMTVFGFTTKMDLTKYGTYFMMGLVGLIVVSLINLFIGSNALNWMISLFGVVLFTALTAYDTQRIRDMANSYEVQSDGSLAVKMSIFGALTLYLDFINLFLFLLRLFGGGGSND